MRHFNAARFMQFITNLVTFSYIKCEFNFFLPIFVNRLERVTSIRFSLRKPAKFSSINIIRLIARTIRVIINTVNIAVSKLEIIFTLFISVFLCRSLLLELRESDESMTI
jgi:hypothetical protein